MAYIRDCFHNSRKFEQTKLGFSQTHPCLKYGQQNRQKEVRRVSGDTYVSRQADYPVRNGDRLRRGLGERTHLHSGHNLYRASTAPNHHYILSFPLILAIIVRPASRMNDLHYAMSLFLHPRLQTEDILTRPLKSHSPGISG